jgi:hypothetical protein
LSERMADPALNNLQSFLAYANKPGAAVYLHAEHASSRRDLARGLAVLLRQPVHAFEFDGDYVEPDQGDVLLQPLLRGETVVAAFTDAHPLALRFLESWRTANKPGLGSYWRPIGRHLTLSIDHSNTTRGVLVIVQVSGERKGPPSRYYLKLPEIAALEQMSRQAEAPPCTSIGVRARAGRVRITFKDLCLLHLRDSASTLTPANLLVSGRSTPVTWTDLREFIRTKGSNVARDLVRLHDEGRLEREQLEFYRDAVDFLDQQQVSAVIDDVYHAVWVYEFLESDGHYFRGQRESTWPLDTTLYRLPPGCASLDLATLVARVQLTSLFVAELRKQQSVLFGREPSDDELLAVAQHYGFATPLLDFTRSLHVAAFFATSGAAQLSADEKSIGIIYYLKPKNRTPSPLLNPVVFESFDLMREAGLQFGDWHVIQPVLADEDNRIARQRGAFLQGANVRHLSGVLGGRILFEQRAGEVFENPPLGVTRAMLLPDNSDLQEVAEDVRKRFTAGERAATDRAFGRTAFPSASLAGVRNAAFKEQVDEATDFFELLRGIAATYDCAALVKDLVATIQRYFADVRTLADLQGGESSNSWPFERALARLCERTGSPSIELSKALEKLMLKWDDEWLWRVPDEAIGGGERRMIDWLTLACALYLVSWENLTCVNGGRARAFAQKARELLHQLRPQQPD